MVQIKQHISRKSLAFLLISIGLTACQNEIKSTAAAADSTLHADSLKPIATDSATLKTSAELAPGVLSFKYDSIAVYSKIVKKEARDTSYARYFYPKFTAQAINNFILGKTFQEETKKKEKVSYAKMAKDFIAGYDDVIADDDSFTQSWFLEERTEVLSHAKNYLALLHTTLEYTGGAHANNASLYWNYNPETGQEIQLESLIKPGTKAKLTAIAEKIFRKQEKLPATGKLPEIYFFEHNKFELNSNFTVTNEGLKFIYNPYEIKAYAYGITELTIPFSDLAPVARPNSLLSPVK